MVIIFLDVYISHLPAISLMVLVEMIFMSVHVEFIYVIRHDY